MGKTNPFDFVQLSTHDILALAPIVGVIIVVLKVYGSVWIKFEGRREGLWRKEGDDQSGQIGGSRWNGINEK